MKFILLGLVKESDDGLEASQEIMISPIATIVKREFKALVLCNKKEIVPILKDVQFSDMVHILKLKYFHGTIESPKKKRRATVRDRRLGFSANLGQNPQEILSSALSKNEELKEPMLGDESFSSKFSESSVSEGSVSEGSFASVSSASSQRSFSVMTPK